MVNKNRPNLANTWKFCKAMWRWIANVYQGGGKDEVDQLKREWINRHGFYSGYLHSDCFFCAYDSRYRSGCKSCPGKKIDPDFECSAPEYCYSNNPKGFYNKIRRMDYRRNQNGTSRSRSK